MLKHASIISFILAIIVVGIFLFFSNSESEPEQSFGSKRANELKSIEQKQQAFFEENGRYLQIKLNNELPDHERGSVREKIGENISNDFIVHTYESPRGKGYVVYWEDEDNWYVQGYGVDAELYTRVTPKPEPPVASSTPPTRRNL